MQLSKKALWLTAGLIAVVVLIFAGIRFYEKGYRVGLPGIIMAPGIIELHHYDPNYTLFLDGEPLSGIPQTTETLRLPVSAGSHEIIISRDHYYPWQKRVDVGARETVTLAPFAIPSSTSGEVLPKTDTEYATAAAAVRAMTIPTEAKPLVSSDGTMSVYLTNTTLIAKVPEGKTPPQFFCDTECKNEHIVLSLEAEVRGVAFMPGRNDVILVAVGNSVYALELDTRGTQNFEPVYQGIKPSFAPGPGYLYVADGPSLFTVALTPGQ